MARDSGWVELAASAAARIRDRVFIRWLCRERREAEGYSGPREQGSPVFPAAAVRFSELPSASSFCPQSILWQEQSGFFALLAEG